MIHCTCSLLMLQVKSHIDVDLYEERKLSVLLRRRHHIFGPTWRVILACFFQWIDWVMAAFSNFLTWSNGYNYYPWYYLIYSFQYTTSSTTMIILRFNFSFEVEKFLITNRFGTGCWPYSISILILLYNLLPKYS